MKIIPRFSGGFLDPNLNSLVRDILLCFSSIPDTDYFTFEVVWVVPFLMSVPTTGNKPRAVSPRLVSCGRAVDVANPTTPVDFGACHWNWVGNNNVSVENVIGLVAGTKYQLTFKVEG